MIADAGGYDVIYYSHLESGIVGQKGVLVPAQYHGGIWGSSVLGWYPPGAQIKLIPELSLALTYNCGYDGFRESAARLGVINFNNKVIIPLNNEFLSYDSENKVFNTNMGNFIYKPDGTKIAGTESRALYDIGDYGYVILGDADYDGKITSIKGVISVRTGKTYTHENLKGNGATDVSAKDTLWVKKNNKWGLVNVDGSIILPFEYDEINDSAWVDKNNPYAIVKKDGKVGLVDISGQVLLPCSYRSIEWADEGYMNIQDDATGKYGIYNFNIKKITTPCIMPGWINTNSGFRSEGYGSIYGTMHINVGNSLNALFDMDAGKQVTGAYLVMKPLGRGLFYNTYYDYFGPDGKVVFNNAEDSSTYTLVVKDGKVGSINASRLKIGGKLPTTAYVKPVPKTISPRFFLVTNPDKVVYKQGESFDITGLIVHYQDENGVRSVVDNSKLKFYISNNAVNQGEALSNSGIKSVDVQYNGKTVADFNINIASVSAGDILEDGDYYMQILGKYVYPVPGGGILWLELSDKKPDKPFTVKLINYNKERGPMYSIEYDGRSIGQPSSKNGDQLRSAAITHAWRINKYSKFCTIRDYGNQKLLVNASGAKSDNGTKVTVWSYTGSAPEHGKVIFIKAD